MAPSLHAGALVVGVGIATHVGRSAASRLAPPTRLLRWQPTYDSQDGLERRCDLEVRGFAEIELVEALGHRTFPLGAERTYAQEGYRVLCVVGDVRVEVGA